MTIASDRRETAIARRDLLTLVGTAATAGFAAVSPALAQPSPATSASAQPQGKNTVTLDRLPTGVLLMGIDRMEAQNRIDIPTFGALGQAYYEFERDAWDARLASGGFSPGDAASDRGVGASHALPRQCSASPPRSRYHLLWHWSWSLFSASVR